MERATDRSTWDAAMQTFISADAEFQAFLPEYREIEQAREVAEGKAANDLPGWGAAVERLEDLGDKAHDARWSLMAMPAPDLPALRWKLEHLLELEGDSVAPWSAEAIADTVADMRRLIVEAG